MSAAGVIVTTPSDTSIVLARDFDAPARLVFAALTRPELLGRWLGARGWHVVDCEIDLRVGGSWRVLSRGPGGAEMRHGGNYREVTPPTRLVYSEAYDYQWFPGEALVIAELVEAGGRTTLTTTLRYASREVRDSVLATPMRRGVAEGYDRLAAVLADLPPAVRKEEEAR
ncbi:MAG TPA: SRPBCC domain-containing protein [Mycobacteriales bacterium]|nr:SRPBCC domain-containing protein [Mycobacteriales bacterium]